MIMPRATGQLLLPANPRKHALMQVWTESIVEVRGGGEVKQRSLFH